MTTGENLLRIAPMNRAAAAKEAVTKAGGATNLARQLLPDDTSDDEIQRMAWRVLKWVQERGVPPKYVLAVERISGVPRHELHPEVYPQDAA